MSCIRVACAWLVAAAAVCSVACLNGLCIALTNGCRVNKVGSVVVVNGDGCCKHGA